MGPAWPMVQLQLVSSGTSSQKLHSYKSTIETQKRVQASFGGIALYSAGMFARTCTRCLARPRAGVLRTNVASMRAQHRAFGTAPSGASTGAASGSGLSVGTLVPIVSELDRMAPSFDLRGENIRVIKTPAEFYETLKVQHYRRLPIRNQDVVGMLKLIQTGPDTQCKTTNLLIDAIHREIRKGAHRHHPRCHATQPPAETEHTNGLLARHTRSAKSILRFVISTACYRVWRRSSRSSHVSYAKLDWAEKKVYSE